MATAPAGLEGVLLPQMLRRMLLIRRFEEQMVRMYRSGRLPGALHPAIGQEAVSVGVCAALEPDDLITSTHRGHGDVIAKGGRVDRMMAELFGRTTGYCRGKGGSLHIAHFSSGIVGATGIVAGGIPLAVGCALAIRMQASRRVVACFFGDGAVATGTFHEGLNLAKLWRLPVVFVRQNNAYAESTPESAYLGIPDVCAWVAGYGIPAAKVDGNDVIAVREAAGRAVARTRMDGGPSFLECVTYRWLGHFAGDIGAYRPREEVEAWKQRDPIPRFRLWLTERRVLSEDAIRDLEAEVEEEVEAAVRFAETSPEPSPDEACADVFA
ncbi:MAG TPA: thiamine pyrophosphate-dependent dehydrogenase E1 component subunit alpha [bacterium]|nr:thiamine pyrophosphate-dependent dehydrogenase E1 component subunit alpha [bacterium]